MLTDDAGVCTACEEDPRAEGDDLCETCRTVLTRVQNPTGRYYTFDEVLDRFHLTRADL